MPSQGSSIARCNPTLRNADLSKERVNASFFSTSTPPFFASFNSSHWKTKRHWLDTRNFVADRIQMEL